MAACSAAIRSKALRCFWVACATAALAWGALASAYKVVEDNASLQTIWSHTCARHTHNLAWRVVGMLLRNPIVGREMPLLGCLDGGAVLQFVAKLGMETMLIRHILHGAHLVLWVHIGESTADHTRSIGHLGMLAIHMAGSTASLVAEHIRTCWNLRFRGDQMGHIGRSDCQQTNDLDMQTGRVICS